MSIILDRASAEETKDMLLHMFTVLYSFRVSHFVIKLHVY